VSSANKFHEHSVDFVCVDNHELIFVTAYDNIFKIFITEKLTAESPNIERTTSSFLVLCGFFLLRNMSFVYFWFSFSKPVLFLASPDESQKPNIRNDGDDLAHIKHWCNFNSFMLETIGRAQSQLCVHLFSISLMLSTPADVLQITRRIRSSRLLVLVRRVPQRVEPVWMLHPEAHKVQLLPMSQRHSHQVRY